MRDEETAWDTKAPAFAVKVRGGLDAAGNLVGTMTTTLAQPITITGYNEPDNGDRPLTHGIEARQNLRPAFRSAGGTPS